MKYALICVFALAAALTQMGCPGDDGNGYVGCGCYAGSTANWFGDTLECCPDPYPSYCTANARCYQDWADAEYWNDNACEYPTSTEYCDGNNATATTDDKAPATECLSLNGKESCSCEAIPAPGK